MTALGKFNGGWGRERSAGLFPFSHRHHHGSNVRRCLVSTCNQNLFNNSVTMLVSLYVAAQRRLTDNSVIDGTRRKSLVVSAVTPPLFICCVQSCTEFKSRGKAAALNAEPRATHTAYRISFAFNHQSPLSFSLPCPNSLPPTRRPPPGSPRTTATSSSPPPCPRRSSWATRRSATRWPARRARPGPVCTSPRARCPDPWPRASRTNPCPGGPPATRRQQPWPSYHTQVPPPKPASTWSVDLVLVGPSRSVGSSSLTLL